MKRENKKIIFTLFSSTLTFLLLLLSFYLNMNNFSKVYESITTSPYYISQNEQARYINYALKLGKPLNRFYGMDKYLNSIKEENEKIKSIYIYDNNSNLLYKTDKKLNEDIYKNKDPKINYYKGKNGYYVYSKLLNMNNHISGYLITKIDKSFIQDKVNLFFKNNLYIVLLLAFVYSFIFFISRNLIIRKDFNYLKKFLIISLLSSQIIYGIYNVYSFNKLYIQNSNTNIKKIENILKNKLDSFDDRNINLKSTSNLNSYLNEIANSIDFVESIELNDYNKYKINDNYSVNSIVKNQNNNYYLNLKISKEHLTNNIFNILLDTFTILVTSILISIELSILYVYLMKKKEEEYLDNHHVEIIRTISFIFIFGTDLALSFIPIVSSNLYNANSFIPKNIALTLPIQGEIITTMIFALITGTIIDKKGWKPVFMNGIIFLVIGMLLSGFSSSIYVFTLSRIIVGIGYGLSWTSMSGFVGCIKDSNERSKGFAYLASGIYAGSNCGVVLGAMIAERTNYSFVFLFSIIFILISALVAYYLTSNLYGSTPAYGSNLSFFKFMSNLKIISFLILITIPAMAMVMFLNYFTPLYAKREAISQSNIGRLFLLNGLIIIYLGPYLIDLLKKFLSNKSIIMLGCLISTLGIYIFTLNNSILYLFLAIIVFSIGDSFGISARSAYYTNLKPCIMLGQGKALSILATIRKLGTFIGASLFSMVFTIDIQNGVFTISLLYFGSIVLFMLINTFVKEKD